MRARERRVVRLEEAERAGVPKRDMETCRLMARVCMGVVNYPRQPTDEEVEEEAQVFFRAPPVRGDVKLLPALRVRLDEVYGPEGRSGK